MARSDYKPSLRTQAAWKRLSAYYGADVIERKYGLEADPSWDRILARLDREVMGTVFAEMKTKHPSFPPTQGEFEQLIKSVTAPPPSNDGPGMQERLTDYVLAHRRLTPWQLSHSSQWRCEYQGNCGRAGTQPSENFATTAIVIPADPNGTAGFRVTVMDMEAGV